MAVLVILAAKNESTEVPNARLCSHECAAKRNECTHFLVYSGTEVVLNRPGYLCSTTYTVAWPY